MIPKYGALGSAIATLISQIIAATAQFIAAKSIFKLRNNYRLMAGAILFVGLSWIIGMNISFLGDDWVVQLFSLLLLSIALSWLVGLFPIRSMLGLLRSRVDSGPIK